MERFTINGNNERGYDIPCNPMSVAKIALNHVHMVKDPWTDKGVSRASDQIVIETIDTAHLRITDDTLF